MNDNKRHITLEPFNTGGLLSEVCRAYLHGANPSVMIKHVIEGTNKYVDENIVAKVGMIEPAERVILGELRNRLEQLYQDMRELEEHHYSM